MPSQRGGRVAVILLLFALIFASRLLVEPASAGLMYLLVAPIGLLAVELGLRGGIAGAVLATLLCIAWVVIADPDLAGLGIGTRIATFFIVGVGTGLLAEERMRLQEVDHRRRDTQERHEQGLELHDDIVQGLAVVKMALELGHVEKAQAALDSTLKKAKGIVSSRLDADVAITRDSPATTETARP